MEHLVRCSNYGEDTAQNSKMFENQQGGTPHIPIEDIWLDIQTRVGKPQKNFNCICPKKIFRPQISVDKDFFVLKNLLNLNFFRSKTLQNLYFYPNLKYFWINSFLPSLIFWNPKGSGQVQQKGCHLLGPHYNLDGLNFISCKKIYNKK